jgi:hypothetical protein
MCCGQKRLHLRNSPARITTRSLPQSPTANRQSQVLPSELSPPPKMAASGRPPAGPIQGAPPTSTPFGSVDLLYLDTPPVRVLGLVTGRRYDFSPPQCVQSVDDRDAVSLLSTRLFRMV